MLLTQGAHEKYMPALCLSLFCSRTQTHVCCRKLGDITYRISTEKVLMRFISTYSTDFSQLN